MHDVVKIDPKVAIEIIYDALIEAIYGPTQTLTRKQLATETWNKILRASE